LASKEPSTPELAAHRQKNEDENDDEDEDDFRNERSRFESSRHRLALVCFRSPQPPSPSLLVPSFLKIVLVVVLVLVFEL
jgi:hypothetical protein